MRVKDVRPFIVDRVCIYIEKSETEYEDIYMGMMKDVPDDILNMPVRVIGAKEKDLLDIEVVV